MVSPEFGRRVVASAPQSTDHGTTDPVLFLSAPVAGGLYGELPSLIGLGNGDPKASTDFRDLDNLPRRRTRHRSRPHPRPRLTTTPAQIVADMIVRGSPSACTG